MSSKITLYILVLIILSCDSSDKPKTIAFEEGFPHKGEILIEDPGMFANPCMLDGKLYIPKFMEHQIDVYNNRGERVSSWGRNGTGPGEFQRPLQIDGNKNKYFVYDMGNNRISIFNKNYEYRGAINLTGFVIGIGYHYDINMDQESIFVFGDRSGSLVKQYDINTGGIIKKFGVTDENSFANYAAGFNSKLNKVSVVHANDQTLRIYSIDEGELVKSIDLNKSPSYVPLNVSRLIDKPETFEEKQQNKEITKKMSYTKINLIEFFEDFILIQFSREGFEQKLPKYFFDIYSNNGELLYSGINHNKGIWFKDENERIYFLSDTEEGRIIRIHQVTIGKNIL